MRAFLIALLTLALLPFAALAQADDRPNTILVLDGSGSMWGQIDGVNKIVIARNVIAEMLENMADDVSLGLTVYGHRERGSCGDIETIVAPAPGTQAQILEAVNAINPRGRTPMTDAVVAAAQSLRSTEEAATVILVSDGIENCNPDPCAIAAELEAAGVAFTAHVIGFDVASEPEARAQMQCIADNTGGQFLTADNAAELSAALEQVVEAALPTPMRIEAQVLPQGTAPTRAVTWTLLGPDGAAVASAVPGPAIDVQLMAGTYVAQATRQEPDGPRTYQTSFNVIEGQTDLIVVAMPPIIETAPMTFTARVEPDMSVPASALAWTLSDTTGTVLLGPVVAPGGNVALLPGEYRLEVERANTGTRHNATFTMEPNTPQEVIIPLPALAVDISFVARIGDVGGVTITDPIIWEVTPIDPAPSLGMTNPASLPMTRGAYRVTAYWTVQEIEQSVDFVVVDQAREIIVVFPVPVATASVAGPAEAPMGSMIEVTWDGPAHDADTISIGQVGAGSWQYVNPVPISTTDNPAMVLMPSEAGPFEIRYTDSETRQVIARTPILSTQVTATVTGPAEVPVGSTFEVSWTGPNYPNDQIGLTTPDAGTNSYVPGRQATANGPMVTMTAPTEPGLYELRYRMNQNGVLLARTAITVVEEIATITAPSSAVAGVMIELGWTGPNNDGDVIGVMLVGAEGRYRYINIQRTDEGNPLDLLMPTVPGDYMLEYALAGDRTAVVSVPITLTPATATITAPATAIAGQTLELGWTGPAYPTDFIGITPVGVEGNYRFINTTRTDEGSPLDLLIPTVPGQYVIEYVFGQDRTQLTSVAITVVASSATLTAPTTAVAGAELEIGWTGPNYSNDFIGITPVGEEGNYRFTHTAPTNEGSPLDLLMPADPGEYVLEYIVGQDRSALVTQPITVTALGATITAPASAIAGSTIELGWTGPGYDNDFIGVMAVGAEGNYRFVNRTPTDEGSPLQLQMPTEPGAYVLEYVLGQDRSALTTVPITISTAGATITAPASAVAGSTVELGWTGPGYDDDFIGVTPVGAEGNYRFANRAGTGNGSPLRLLMPTEPGAYVLEYVVGQDRSALTTVPITITGAQASITAPTSAVAGSTIEVSWTGPDYASDYIGIGRSGAEGGQQWQNYASTEDGAVLRLQTPAEPGSYLIRYFVHQDRSVLVEVQIELTAAAASITAPTTAVAGSTIEVAWTGPDYSRDYIGIGRVGATGNGQWENFTRTEAGSPLELVTPPLPGTYVIRYFVDQDRVVQAEAQITLTAPTATITAPASAPIGSTVEIAWTGPDYSRDYIGVGRVGADGNQQWENFARTDTGSPMQLVMPTEPGEYLIRYFVDQDRVALTEVPITLMDVTATLIAPATAVAGGTIQVQWTGPDYSRDYIGFGRVGATGNGQWETYTRTSSGSPATLNVPDTPGSYVLRYFIDQNRVMIAEVAIEVQ